jgi:adenylate cyclase
MFTDMAGSTASAQLNEAEALRLRHEQAGLLRSLFAAHQGREIKSMGDGFLAEFESALRATQCAIEIQRRIFERNATSGASPIHLRIGIHLGDVEQQGSDIFGDAVNIASRIQPVAEIGGICVSHAVQEQVWNKISDRLERLPPTALKGLRTPVELFRIVLPWTVPEPRAVRVGSAGLAVLPFTNMSVDPSDLYFADGLTEELITVLSQIKDLRVIARTSVMPYKSTSKGVAQIGAELRVSSILEGSVRKAGNRLRVTAQLIDVESEGHVWARSYDRELVDVFAVQSEVARQVAGALRVELRPGEVARLEARPVVKPESYLACLKGRTLLNRDTKRATLEAAKERFQAAISLDEGNAAAYSGLADTVTRLGWWHRDLPPEESEQVTRRLVARAIELDPNLAEAHQSLGLVLWRNDLVAAEKEVRLAISLNPSYSQAHNTLANMLQDGNRPEEALVEFSLAEEADPAWILNLYHMAHLLIWLGRLDEAHAKIQRIDALDPADLGYRATRAEYYLARSDLEQARKELELAERLTDEPRDKMLWRALSLAWAGERDQARSILKNNESLPARPTRAADVARIYAELGDLDECFRWLDTAYSTVTLPLQPWRLNPRLERVRRDPRFQELLKKRNLA